MRLELLLAAVHAPGVSSVSLTLPLPTDPKEWACRVVEHAEALEAELARREDAKLATPPDILIAPDGSVELRAVDGKPVGADAALHAEVQRLRAELHEARAEAADWQKERDALIEERRVLWLERDEAREHEGAWKELAVARAARTQVEGKEMAEVEPAALRVGAARQRLIDLGLDPLTGESLRKGEQR